ncbi:hypothetical protein EZMO1_3391 [Endozoicomonas montiporae CL-33]|uniref:Uncharacterized protein n=1 Tax=Endozoicomonas montiporae CL-33 TaxID=570277 RepID=A0A142BF56_9GAMM|nr:hypothetical protein EZMO1_3391 [Endozoicomonas montiporae CL-33]
MISLPVTIVHFTINNEQLLRSVNFACFVFNLALCELRNVRRMIGCLNWELCEHGCEAYLVWHAAAWLNTEKPALRNLNAGFSDVFDAV